MEQETAKITLNCKENIAKQHLLLEHKANYRRMKERVVSQSMKDEQEEGIECTPELLNLIEITYYSP